MTTGANAGKERNVYTSADVRASVSSIHERARTTQQTAQEAPGAHSGYRGARSSARVTTRPRADLHSELHSEARAEMSAMLRRLDFLLSSQPPPSPALTRSLLYSLQREGERLAGLLDALAPADLHTDLAPDAPVVSVPLSRVSLEGAPC